MNERDERKWLDFVWQRGYIKKFEMEPKVSASSADAVVLVKSEKTGHAIAIDEILCKGCTICVEICPKDVLEMVDAIDRWEGAIARVKDIDACIACFICEHECPDFALLVYAAPKAKAAQATEV